MNSFKANPFTLWTANNYQDDCPHSFQGACERLQTFGLRSFSRFYGNSWGFSTGMDILIDEYTIVTIIPFQLEDDPEEIGFSIETTKKIPEDSLKRCILSNEAFLQDQREAFGNRFLIKSISMKISTFECIDHKIRQANWKKYAAFLGYLIS